MFKKKSNDGRLKKTLWSQNQRPHRPKPVIRQENGGADTENIGKLVFLMLFIFGCLILTMSVIGDSGLIALAKIEGKLAETEQEILHLRQKEQLLKEEIHALQSNKDYLEALARRELGLVKKDEKIVQFVPPGYLSKTPKEPRPEKPLRKE